MRVSWVEQIVLYEGFLSAPDIRSKPTALLYTYLRFLCSAYPLSLLLLFVGIT